jgi:3-polyprenyl-4-hydroxybenzoate decarboxylase
MTTCGNGWCWPSGSARSAPCAGRAGRRTSASPPEAILRAADVDVTDLEHLLWAVLTRTDPKESIRFIEGSWDSPADPRLSPERRAAGDMTHSVAVINACRPYHWRDKFPPANAPSAAVARKARERFDWLLDGSRQT